MGTLIKQELYKLNHKKGTWLALAFMVVVQIGFAVLSWRYPKFFGTSMLVMNNYVGGMLVDFIMIASAASMIAMEFQYGTIKQLLYRKYYRSQVFISKLITLLMQMIGLQFVASAMTGILTFIIKPKFDWTQTANAMPIWRDYLLTTGGSMLVMLMILSLVILMATMFKTNAAAIACGFIGYFVTAVAAQIIIMFVQRWHWLKWNPFTMLLTGNQIADPKTYHALTMLDTPVMIACTLGYTVLFTLIAYLSFRRRAV